MKKHLYNKRTGKLHIKGCCCHSNGLVDSIEFETEAEALAYDGRAVSFCKICESKKESMINCK